MSRLTVAIVHDPRRLARVAALEQAITRELGARAQLRRYPAQSADEVPQRARQAVEEGCDVLIPGGGDGTLWGVLNGMAGSHAALLPAPLGTSNDYARAWGLHSLQAAAQALAAGHSRQADIAQLDYAGLDGAKCTTWVCSSAGVGFIAELFTAERRPRVAAARRLLGDLIYAPLALGLLATCEGSDVVLKIDGRRIATTLTFLEFAKVPATGGFPITPQAAPDSGWLDACLAHRRSLPGRVRLLLECMLARHVGRSYIDYFCGDAQTNQHALARVRCIEVDSARPLAVHAHGELIGVTPCRIELVPRQLRVICRAPAASTPP